MSQLEQSITVKSKTRWVLPTVLVAFLGAAGVLSVLFFQPVIDDFRKPQVESGDDTVYVRGSSSYPVETEDDPSLGVKNTRLVIVQFTDPLCAECREHAQMLRQELAAYTGQLEWIVRDYPNPDDQMAVIAAQGGFCAQQQGKFWIYHDRLVLRPRPANSEALIALAADVGLETGRFQSCLQSDEAKLEVDEDIRAGREAGVSGAPAYFFNGKLLHTPLTTTKLYQILDQIYPDAAGLRDPEALITSQSI